MNVFLSYAFDDENPLVEAFVHRVSYYLSQQPDLVPYAYAQERRQDDWRHVVGEHMGACDRFVLFVGPRLGTTQTHEATVFLEQFAAELSERAFVVYLPDHCRLEDSELFQFAGVRKEQRFNVARVEYQSPAEQGFWDDLEDDNTSPIGVALFDEQEARECARRVTAGLTKKPAFVADGLPGGYLFAYEKAIIDRFVGGGGRITDPKLIQSGCPQRWPVVRKRHASAANPVPEELIGKRRPDGAMILVDTRSDYHSAGREPEAEPERRATGICLTRLGLALPEAGPRQYLCHPQYDSLRVAILVSGGIAPGINAVIEGIVQRHELYREYLGRTLKQQIRGYYNGLVGLRLGQFAPLSADAAPVQGEIGVRGIADKGGSRIGTSRLDKLIDSSSPDARREADEMLGDVVHALVDPDKRIDILYVIGGDGSMRAAHAIWTRAEELRLAHPRQHPLSVVGIPKTMDNDILWVWQGFGFMSAVEKAREFVYSLHTEASSNPRVGIVQIFGSDSGFVVSHAALASGVCDAALIPEVPFTIEALSEHIRERLQDRSERPYALILLAETAIPQDVDQYLESPVIALSDGEKRAVRKFLEDGRRVRGQTPDDLRQAGLKIVSRAIKHDINEMGGTWDGFRVFTNEPRHVLRSIEPSVSDIIFAQRLGVLAVDNAMAGYSDFMISQWLTEYVMVPLRLAVLGRKRVPPKGIFWKSVLARTGQARGNGALIAVD